MVNGAGALFCLAYFFFLQSAALAAVPRFFRLRRFSYQQHKLPFSGYYLCAIACLRKKRSERTSRKHNTPSGAALPRERITARTAVFTEATRAGFELATLRLCT